MAAVVMMVMIGLITTVLMMGLVVAPNDSENKILKFHGLAIGLNTTALCTRSRGFEPQHTFLHNGRKDVRKGERKPSEWDVAQLVECLSSRRPRPHPRTSGVYLQC